jgi:hypothetical protein
MSHLADPHWAGLATHNENRGGACHGVRGGDATLCQQAGGMTTSGMALEQDQRVGDPIWATREEEAQHS